MAWNMYGSIEPTLKKREIPLFLCPIINPGCLSPHSTRIALQDFQFFFVKTATSFLAVELGKEKFQTKLDQMLIFKPTSDKEKGNK